MTQLREQEALTQSRYESLYTAVRTVLAGHDENSLFKEKLGNVHERLMDVMEAADEKVSLAQHLHKTVQHHVKYLEDEICCFEEEVRLARTYGELDEEPEKEEDSPLEELVTKGNPTTTVTATSTFNSNSNSRNKRRKSNKDEEVEGDEEEKKSSPRMVDTGEFDSVSPKRSRGSRTEPPSTKVKSPNNEPVYCICNQVSFGEMIGCDNPDCEVEWFHYPCVGLDAPPPGKWFCPDCQAREIKKGNGSSTRQRSQ